MVNIPYKIKITKQGKIHSYIWDCPHSQDKDNIQKIVYIVNNCIIDR